MATLPSASTRIDDQAGPGGTGTDLITVIAAVPLNADAVPRMFSSTRALLAQHGYSDGAEYAAFHFAKTRKQVLFVGVPIVTPGAIGRLNTSGNTGTSVCSVAAGASGPLCETDGVVTVITGGTVGTSQIVLGLSLDGGRRTKRLRLGTGTSYAIPYSGLTIRLTVGTLTAGQTILTWHTSAPRWDQAGLEAARAALESQQRQCRSWMVVGDLLTKTDADDVLAEANGYETEKSRFIFARCSIRDRLPQAELSDTQQRMTGAPNVTFADVGAGNDTLTRSVGSFTTDGFVTGDTVRVTGAVASAGANNVVGVVTVAATALTFPAAGIALVAEGPIAGVSITSEPTLTFAEAGDADTITRNRGSWLDDGFRAGDIITITGTASNNVTGPIATVTATIVTMTAATDLAAEVIGTHPVTIVCGETKAQWAAATEAVFEAVTDEPRIDISRGRARPDVASIDGWSYRRPASWAASLIEYDAAHDVHIPTWRVSDGPTGWDLNDTEGNLVEWDEDADGGDTTFTSFRTWPNLTGCYLGLSLTRALEGSLLSRTHNMAVACLAQAVCDAAATQAVGQVLVLTAVDNAGNAYGTPASLDEIRQRVEGALRRALLQDNGGKGPRASSVSWTPSATDILNQPGATIHGVLSLGLNGTVEHIETIVKVQ